MLTLAERRQFVDDLELVVSRRLAKAETAASRKERDRLQALYLKDFINALRDYYVGFAERIGVEIDTTLPEQRTPRMVNPDKDIRTKTILKRKTFIGLPTRAPFDLPVNWKAEADILADAMSKEYLKWLNFGTKRAATDIALVNADIGAVRGLAGSLQLGDYDRSIRSSLANLVVRVNEVQRTVIRDTVQRGIEAGLSTKEIANGGRVAGRVYPGIKGRVEEFYRNRSRVIALTESANAYNLGQLEGYDRSGVVDEVRIFDGLDCGWTNHDDPDKANGTTRTMADARAHPTSHPNCQRSWAPVPLGQTQGVGRTADPATGAKTTPKTQPGGESAKVPDLKGPGDVGNPASRFSQMEFDEVIQHVLPDGYTYDPLDGTLIKPNGFLDRAYNLGVDKAGKARLEEVYVQRYGLRSVKFPRTTQRGVINYEDQISAMRAFEDYRAQGIGFDDLDLVFDGSGTKAALTGVDGGGVKWAHYDNYARGGEIRVYPTLTNSLDDIRIRGLPDRNISSGFHGTETSYQATLRHELGHALDARTMGGASRGTRYVRNLVDRELGLEFESLHDLSGASTSTASPQAAKQAASQIRKALATLDDDIAQYRSLIDAGDTDPRIARLLTDAQRKQTLYRAHAKNLDDIAAGRAVERYPTNYAAKSLAEDVAESIDMYLADPTGFKRNFPRRAELVERVLTKGRTLPKDYASVPRPDALNNLLRAAEQKAARQAEKAKAAAARRKAAAEAKRRAEEEAKRRAAEEAARREAARRAREEAERLAREEAERRAREQGTYRSLRTQGADDPQFDPRGDLWRSRKAEADLEFGYRGDSTHATINSITGADGKPLIIDNVDDLVRNGWTESFRTVNGSQYIEQFRTGSLFPGEGIYGNGTYATITGSSRYAAYYGSKTYGTTIVRMAIDPRARVITSEKVERAWRIAKAELEERLSIAQFEKLKAAGKVSPQYRTYDDLLTVTQDVYAKTADVSALGDIRKAVRVAIENDHPVYADVGRWATAEGYDVILVEGGNFSQPGLTDYVVILNRTAVAVERKDFVGAVIEGTASDVPLGTPAIRAGAGSR